MKRTRRSHKTHTFSIRVPEKMRFGLDVLATKHNAHMSALVIRAIEDMFEREALTTREPGQLLSLLDKLWSPSHYTRALNLRNLAPELLPEDEKMALDGFEEFLEKEREEGREVDPKELDSTFLEFLRWTRDPDWGGEKPD